MPPEHLCLHSRGGDVPDTGAARRSARVDDRRAALERVGGFVRTPRGTSIDQALLDTLRSRREHPADGRPESPRRRVAAALPHGMEDGQDLRSRDLRDRTCAELWPPEVEQPGDLAERGAGGTLASPLRGQLVGNPLDVLAAMSTFCKQSFVYEQRVVGEELSGSANVELVPRGGIEPPTLRFSVACSTN